MSEAFVIAGGPPQGGLGSGSRGLSLEELVREVPGAALVNGDRAGAIAITGVRHDSRCVERGDLFVARAGARASVGNAAQPPITTARFQGPALPGSATSSSSG